MTAIVDGERRRDYTGLHEKGLIVPAIFEAKSTSMARIKILRKEILRKKTKGELYIEFW